MIHLGKFNTLTILRDTRVGVFLGDGEGNEVLLPTKYVPEEFGIGDSVGVFCYLDNEQRMVATTLEPYVSVGGFQLLQVAEVNEYGAFLDWGIEKHLLVPFKEQRAQMQEGNWYIVHCYVDEHSNRLVASSKLDKFLSNGNIEFSRGDEVDVLVVRKTQLGWEVIIENRHKGLAYFNEVFKDLEIGEVHRAVIKTIRPDQKIDISFQPLGKHVLEPAANKIYGTLVEQGGFLPLHDKSDPEKIRHTLQMSKKTFKKGIGTLYKARKIEILKNGIKKI